MVRRSGWRCPKLRSSIRPASGPLLISTLTFPIVTADVLEIRSDLTARAPPSERCTFERDADDFAPGVPPRAQRRAVAVLTPALSATDRIASARAWRAAARVCFGDLPDARAALVAVRTARSAAHLARSPSFICEDRPRMRSPTVRPSRDPDPPPAGGEPFEERRRAGSFRGWFLLVLTAMPRPVARIRTLPATQWDPSDHGRAPPGLGNWATSSGLAVRGRVSPTDRKAHV